MKTGERIVLILTAAALLAALAACGPAAEQESAPAASPAPAGEESAAPEVAKLTIVQEPEKMSYEEGETFDPAGVVLNATLKDGTVLENVAYEGIIVDSPLTRTTLFAKFVYGGKTADLKIGVTLKGNRPEYFAALTPPLEDSPLKGKTIFWLGSSVTEGASSGKESMVDFIAAKHGALCIKEAVSGTTLMDTMNKSYVSRLDRYLASDGRAEQVDAFVCQLSTNDKGAPDRFGAVTPEDVRDPAAFDTGTTFGAMEYIIATARAAWDCPIFFYTNPPLEDDNYGLMVDGLDQIAAKWGVTVIDMYRDEAFNDITEEQRLLYMADKIHPTRAGYRDWWLPKFEQALYTIVPEQGNG